MEQKEIAEKLQFTFYIVVLLDLLGQSDQLDKFTIFPKTEQEMEEFRSIYRRTIGPVLHFREQIQNLHKNFSKPITIPDTIRNKLTPSQLELAKKYSRPIIGVQFFSDLAILKINLAAQKDYSPLFSIHTLFIELAILMLINIALGDPLRGAIDVGICVELSENDLYGQALSRAYKLESKVADYSRIVIGKGFINYLDSFEKAEVQNEEKILMNFYLALIKEFLAVDTDGKPIFSYLSSGARRYYQESEGSLENALKAACQFIRNAVRQYAQIGEIKLEARYSRMMDYFKKNDCWRNQDPWGGGRP